MTSSTDGRCLWWDARKLTQPVDILNVVEDSTGDENAPLIGATTLEYNIEAGPNKYLIGTENGYVYSALKKMKSKIDIVTRYGLDSGRHLGPVYAIHRNPSNPKYFLSIGDWSAKVWVDDTKQPLIRTCYHNAYLADGCWSP